MNIFRTLRRWLGSEEQSSSPAPVKTSLSLESLDGRFVPAQITLSNGVLHVEGSSKADVVKVAIEDQGTATPFDDRVRVSLSQPGMSQTVWFNRFNGALPAVNSIEFNGYAGDDQFFNMTDLPSLAHGHSGNDIFVGGSGKDQLYGDGGDDMLYGGAGDDTLVGDTGLPDWVAAAMEGLNGKDGNDYLEGGDGTNTMYGGNGDDFFWGGDNKDIMYGGNGFDTMYGNKGNDIIYGEAGNDYIHGDAGADFLSGGDGDDNMSGGADNDTMNGGIGDDGMSGDGGNDTLWGESGKDYLYGNDGNDDLYGGDGNDHLFGGIGNDGLYGGKGNDVMYGDSGQDYLYGNEGDDYLNGGSQGGSPKDGSVDLLNGGAGVDYFRFEDENTLAGMQESYFSDYVQGVDHKP